MNRLEKESTCKECMFSFMKHNFSDNDLCEIEQNRGETAFHSGEIIIKQGTFISQILYLKEGIVKIVLEGKQGRHSVLKIVEKKNFIALPFATAPAVYPFSVIALTDSKICVIRKETFAEIIKTNHSVNQYILEQYRTDSLFLFNRIDVLSTRNNHGKLASALMYLCSDSFETNILTIISRKELAQLASISVESTNKILVEFKNDGLIEITKTGIEIINAELIKQLSANG